LVRKLILAPLVALLLLVGSSTNAHVPDLAKPARMGPIRRNQTTMAQMRKWFGDPTVRKVIRVACIRVIKARWGRSLMVYAYRDEARRIGAVFVKKASLQSTKHGALRIHTFKGLRVGDGVRKLRRLYPRSEGDTHAGHTHFRLKTGRYGAYLLARVESRRVVQLEAWPYEFC
jgi:hypothetical protein